LSDLIQKWKDLFEVMNAGDFVAMDEFFHPDFVYDNPSRPDLRTYQEWKKSPMHLYETFIPNNYIVKDAVASENQVWAYCVNDTRHVGGPYMGAEPSNKPVYIEWFSIIEFKDDKIVRIFSIADVLGMLLQIGAIDKSLTPVNPQGDLNERLATIADLESAGS
jgi:predicted ester cyclase